jgi:hypothetical protein
MKCDLRKIPTIYHMEAESIVETNNPHHTTLKSSKTKTPGSSEVGHVAT